MFMSGNFCRFSFETSVVTYTSKLQVILPPPPPTTTSTPHTVYGLTCSDKQTQQSLQSFDVFCPSTSGYTFYIYSPTSTTRSDYRSHKSLYDQKQIVDDDIPRKARLHNNVYIKGVFALMRIKTN